MGDIQILDYGSDMSETCIFWRDLGLGYMGVMYPKH